MKRLLAFFLSTILLLALCACGEKPSDSTPPAGNDNVYKGLLGNKTTTVTIDGDKASFTEEESYTYTEEQISAMGVSGTLSATQITRIPLNVASLENGVLTLTGETKTAYAKMTFEGTAAEQYKTKIRQTYQENYNAGKIAQDVYERYMSLINGEETVIEEDETANFTVVIELNKEKHTCLITSMKLETEKYTDFTVYEYENSRVVKETNYNDDTNWSDATVITYYEDGKTEKTREFYELGKENGTYSLGKRFSRNEYYANGNKSRSINYADDGVTISYEELYDENENSIRENIYDDNGEIYRYSIYEYTENTFTRYTYQNDRLTEKSVYVVIDQYDSYPTLRIEYYEDGGRGEFTYYEYSYQEHTFTYYDKDGFVVSSGSYEYE